MAEQLVFIELGIIKIPGINKLGFIGLEPFGSRDVNCSDCLAFIGPELLGSRDNRSLAFIGPESF